MACQRDYKLAEPIPSIPLGSRLRGNDDSDDLLLYGVRVWGTRNWQVPVLPPGGRLSVILFHLV